MYNVNDLYLAVIKITCPSVDFDYQTGLLRSGVNNYEYPTILLKSGNAYIDLQRPKRSHGQMSSYKIKILEPLSNYYTFTGEKKRIISKKKAVEAVKTYYKSL